MTISDAAELAMDAIRDRAHRLATDIGKLPLTKQERLGLSVVAASALVGGSAAILNHIAIDKGHKPFPMTEVTKAVMDLIVEEMRKAH